MFDPKNQRKAERPAIVRQRKKYHYTITPIGGAADLARWKQDQEVKEVEWQAAQADARAERRQNAIDIVSGVTQAPTTMSRAEALEADYSRIRNLGARPLESVRHQVVSGQTVNVGMSSWHSVRSQDSSAEPAWVAEPPKKKSTWTKVKDFFKSMWTSANFS